VKVIDLGSAKKDDPIYTGGLQMFSVQHLSKDQTTSTNDKSMATPAQAPDSQPTQTPAAKGNSMSNLRLRLTSGWLGTIARWFGAK